MLIDPKIFQLKSNTAGRKASVKWMPHRKALVFQVAEQSYEGLDPLRWTAEISLGELINELHLTREDVTAAVEIDIALGNKSVNYDTGWFKRERVPTGERRKHRKVEWRAPSEESNGSSKPGQEPGED
jgi:hypothetical protein